MPDASPRLSLPYLQPSQAQKHVTHNDALERLDTLVQLSVAAFDATQPPATPQEGEIHALGAGASHAWAGQDGNLAVWTNGAWQFIAPQEGWRAWGRAEGSFRVHTGTAWEPVTPETQNLDGVGVMTASDSVNRLAVAAKASLFSHAGSGHRMKINKAAAGDTASLLFQSGWVGHAEMGLAGNTDWAIKVSPDGGTWTEALVIDATTGLASGAAVQQDATDTAPGRLMRADFGYGPGNLVGTVTQAGGQPTGAVIESGTGAGGAYLRLADGTQLCWGTLAHSVDITTAEGGAYASAALSASFPVPFAAPPAVTLSAIQDAGTRDGWASLDGATTSDFSFAYLKLTQATAQARTLHYHAAGRWA